MFCSRCVDTISRTRTSQRRAQRDSKDAKLNNSEARSRCFRLCVVLLGFRRHRLADLGARAGTLNHELSKFLSRESEESFAGG